MWHPRPGTVFAAPRADRVAPIMPSAAVDVLVDSFQSYYEHDRYEHQQVLTTRTGLLSLDNRPWTLECSANEARLLHDYLEAEWQYPCARTARTDIEPWKSTASCRCLQLGTIKLTLLSVIRPRLAREIASLTRSISFPVSQPWTGSGPVIAIPPSPLKRPGEDLVHAGHVPYPRLAASLDSLTEVPVVQLRRPKPNRRPRRE